MLELFQGAGKACRNGLQLPWQVLGINLESKVFLGNLAHRLRKPGQGCQAQAHQHPSPRDDAREGRQAYPQQCNAHRQQRGPSLVCLLSQLVVPFVSKLHQLPVQHGGIARILDEDYLRREVSARERTWRWSHAVHGRSFLSLGELEGEPRAGKDIEARPRYVGLERHAPQFPARLRLDVVEVFHEGLDNFANLRFQGKHMTAHFFGMLLELALAAVSLKVFLSLVLIRIGMMASASSITISLGCILYNGWARKPPDAIHRPTLRYPCG